MKKKYILVAFTILALSACGGKTGNDSQDDVKEPEPAPLAENPPVGASDIDDIVSHVKRTREDKNPTQPADNATN